MASPVVVDPGVVAANVDAAADERFEAVKAQLLAGGEPIPPAASQPPVVPAPVAPVQPETPAAQPAAQPQSATPAAAPSPQQPTPPAPAAPTAPPADVITIDLKALPAEEQQAWKDALVKTGNDPSKVASLMWQYNNRLAALHSGAPQAAPTATPSTAQPAAPAPPVQERIDAELMSALPQDQRVQELRSELSAHVQTIKTICEPLGVKFEDTRAALPSISAALDKLDRDRDHFERTLADPDRDMSRDEDLNRKLMAIERQQMRLDSLKGKVEGLHNSFNVRREELRQAIAERVEDQQANADAERDAASYEQEFKAAWPSYVNAAMSAAGIDPELVADFNEFAQAQTLLASNAKTPKVDLAKHAAPSSLPPFLATVAAAYKTRTEAVHRAVVAAHARRAAQTGAPQPIVIPDGMTQAPVAQGQNPASNVAPMRAADIDEAADNRASQLLAALRG